MASSIRLLPAAEFPRHLDALTELLQDAVDSGASVGFLPPLATTEAQHYWRSLQNDLVAGHVLLLVAEEAGEVVGTVQLHLATKANAAHRAEVAKLLVHRRAQRRGIGRHLMQAVEDLARQQHRTTLVLDTLQGAPSELLYQCLGYVAAGVIPRFARVADGSLQPTVVYYKLLG
ncbi:GNAT family N-acetyltransferase [Hymenobacter weizhouensis]|uniref:GNAT family N-acetyltransferase n=1 Tax=Hymenobacter sp. YIM 151500-1 TaxID=2987689 RepID=UPI00222724FA|nr:GNAT family N-acetyltransferase [Hymenobacter sp. YIM 151500-1]UYZ62763.1 GNAT family N-acetyltransferase [Hymenobacter sp. YIM 151500-1]